MRDIFHGWWYFKQLVVSNFFTLAQWFVDLLRNFSGWKAMLALLPWRHENSSWVHMDMSFGFSCWGGGGIGGGWFGRGWWGGGCRGGGRWRENCCGGGCGLGLNVGGGGKLFHERSRPLRYVPSVRPRSSSLRDNLLISWTTPSKVELIAQILHSILPILVKGWIVRRRLRPSSVCLPKLWYQLMLMGKQGRQTTRARSRSSADEPRRNLHVGITTRARTTRIHEPKEQLKSTSKYEEKLKSLLIKVGW